MLPLLLGLAAPTADAAATEADALYEQAQAEDARLDFADAARDYQASVARLPSNPHAAHALARVQTLEHHSEGGYAPLVRLETVRRDRTLADDPAALDALAREADAWPPGQVRGEARMLVAEAYMGRLRRPRAAIPLLREVTDDPAADPLTARQARHMLVDTLVGLNDYSGAEAAAELPDPDPSLVSYVTRVVRRQRLHFVSVYTVITFVAVAIATIARAQANARREGARAAASFARVAVPYAAWVALAGGLLASSYESGNARPFLVLGGVVLLVATLARAWAAAGGEAPLFRGARAVVSAAAVVAAAFLVLESVDVAYLEGFGL